MNLLEGYKDQVSGAMNDIFDTFANSTPFVFYKPSIEEVVIFDSFFNADLSEYSNPNVTLTEQFQEFRCRVIYPKRENTWSNFIEGGANIQVKGEQDLGIIYLQMKDDAFEYLKDSIRFTFMGDKYQKLTSPRKIGVLDTFNINQIVLKKVN